MKKEQASNTNEMYALEQLSHFIRARDKLAAAYIANQVDEMKLSREEIGALLHFLKELEKATWL